MQGVGERVDGWMDTLKQPHNMYTHTDTHTHAIQYIKDEHTHTHLGAANLELIAL